MHESIPNTNTPHPGQLLPANFDTAGYLINQVSNPKAFDNRLKAAHPGINSHGVIKITLILM